MKARVRYMRIIVFFDLPMDTPAQRRHYAKFRKKLIKAGFLMLQKSVYSKLAINDRVANGVINKLNEIKPPQGLVQALKVTERQYASIVQIVGDSSEREELEDTSNLVVL